MKESKPKLKISHKEPAIPQPPPQKKEFDCVIEFKAKIMWNDLVPKLI